MPLAAGRRSVSEEAILAELRQQAWMGRDPRGSPGCEERWYKVQARFIGVSHTGWFSVGTDEVVPLHDPGCRWAQLSGGAWQRVKTKSAAKPGKPQRAALVGRAAGLGLSFAQVKAAPTGPPQPGLRCEQPYRVEITALAQGQVTLHWFFPPGNPRDCGCWIGLYPLRGTPPDVPPSRGLRSHRTTFKYITKNSQAGELKFNVTSALKPRRRTDDVYFFALHAHSIATMLATSQMVTVRQGNPVEFEQDGCQTSPHDPAAETSGRREPAKPCEPPAVTDKQIKEDKPTESEPQSDAPSEPSRRRTQRSRLLNGGPSSPVAEEQHRSKPPKTEPERIQKPSKRKVERAAAPKEPEAPPGVAEQGKPMPKQEPVAGLEMVRVVEPSSEEDHTEQRYEVRVRESTGPTITFQWRFPPGNPSDSSAYVSLYPLYAWRDVPLPHSQPEKSCFGYKYITQNGMSGSMNFTMLPNAPSYDGLYVFALHCADVVQALSQPILVHKQRVQEIQHHSGMKSCVHTPIARKRVPKQVHKLIDQVLDEAPPRNQAGLKKRRRPDAVKPVKAESPANGKEARKQAAGASRKEPVRSNQADDMETCVIAQLAGRPAARTGSEASVAPLKKRKHEHDMLEERVSDTQRSAEQARKTDGALHRVPLKLRKAQLRKEGNIVPEPMQPEAAAPIPNGQVAR